MKPFATRNITLTVLVLCAFNTAAQTDHCDDATCLKHIPPTTLVSPAQQDLVVTEYHENNNTENYSISEISTETEIEQVMTMSDPVITKTAESMVETEPQESNHTLSVDVSSTDDVYFKTEVEKVTASSDSDPAQTTKSLDENDLTEKHETPQKTVDTQGTLPINSVKYLARKDKTAEVTPKTEVEQQVTESTDPATAEAIAETKESLVEINSKESSQTRSVEDDITPLVSPETKVEQVTKSSDPATAEAITETKEFLVEINSKESSQTRSVEDDITPLVSPETEVEQVTKSSDLVFETTEYLAKNKSEEDKDKKSVEATRTSGFSTDTEFEVETLLPYQETTKTLTIETGLVSKTIAAVPHRKRRLFMKFFL